MSGSNQLAVLSSIEPDERSGVCGMCLRAVSFFSASRPNTCRRCAARIQKARRLAVLEHRVAPDRCEGCLKDFQGPLERHHDDYAAPLSIRWLCRKCHRSADDERRQRETTMRGRGIPPLPKRRPAKCEYCGRHGDFGICYGCGAQNVPVWPDADCFIKNGESLNGAVDGLR